jgi:cold shock CspA family protein
MIFRDRWETDQDGQQYIFTVEMQRVLHDAGLPVEPASLNELPSRTLQELDIPSRGPEPSMEAEESEPSEPSQPKKSADTGEPETIQLDPETGKFVGRLKTYRSDRGFGFIARGGGESIFFHRTKTLDDPETFENGDWLLYEVRETPRGREAYDVQRYEGSLLS